MASWYKVTLSDEDVLAGKRFSLQEAFEDLFMANGIPADAAIFTTSIVVSPQLFLFSPGAARIAKVLIEAYSGIECAAPMAAGLALLVGHRGSERIPFASMSAQDSERRVYPRLPAPKGTIVAWHSSNKRLVSAVDNLGLGGLFIRTPSPPATGTFIQLLLDAPTGEVRARAAVQRSSPKQGMGVKFVAMEQEDRARFAGWLKTLSS
jgi:hypothetical protein